MPEPKTKRETLAEATSATAVEGDGTIAAKMADAPIKTPKKKEKRR